MKPMDEVIQIKDLRREYSKSKGFIKRKKTIVNAVDGITFTVNRGEVFGLLGENGAGKTTTIKMMITMLAPTSGICKVLGFNTFGEEEKIRSKINFIFGGEMGVYRRLSARDNLQYFANLYYIPQDIARKKIIETLEIVGLSDKADTLVETYSKGMIQRLQIARGLMNDAEILFMDEPTIGLDPIGARALRDLIKKLKEHGKTIVLTTHYMYEADELCDRIAIMNKGKIVALDTPKGLKDQIEPLKTLEFTVKSTNDSYIEEIRQINGVKSVTCNNCDIIAKGISMAEGDSTDTYTYIIKHDINTEIASDVLKIAKNILSLSQKEVTLEDVFIQLIGRGITK